MTTIHLLAEAVSSNRDFLQIGGAAAFLTVLTTLGKLVLNKMDKFHAALVKAQEQALRDMRDSHAEQIATLQRSHSAQIESMQSTHAAQLEVLTGITTDSQRAMTALTVQIDRYTREMRDLTDAINTCPGVVVHKENQRKVPVANDH